MEQFFNSFRRAVRRVRRSGAKITYEITVEKDGKKRTVRSEDYERKETASGQTDFELAEAKKLERSLRAVESNGWISVEDRLPDEMSGKVLMTDGKSHYLAPREWMHRVNGADGIYIPANHGAGAKITHWMPLPEPPAALAGKGGGQ